MLKDENISEYSNDIERVRIQKDQILLHQNKKANNVYIVITGMLQAVMTLKSGKEAIVG